MRRRRRRQENEETRWWLTVANFKFRLLESGVMYRLLVAAGSLAFDHISKLVFSSLRAYAHATTIGDLRECRPGVRP